MEPLFFFVLFEEAQSGVTGNLSRILQVVTLAVLAVRLLWRITGAPPRTVPIPNPFIPLYRRFSVMFILAIAAGIVGYFRGAYEMPAASSSLAGERSWFSGTLNSASVRPIFGIRDGVLLRLLRRAASISADERRGYRYALSGSSGCL
jgi:hypothetical protein